MSDEARSESREAWEEAAAGWGKRAADLQRSVAPVSEWLVDAIAPQPGHVVLEVAAGAGETGFLAAELVKPGGRLICTDGAEAMVDVARARGAQLGLDNVEYRTMEAEWLDLDAASIDAILCRFGYMLLEDPEAGLRDARRVLRPSGRIALAVWDKPELNPAMTAGGKALAAIGRAPERKPDEPGPFRLSDDGALTELLETAGFTEIEVMGVDVVNTFASLDDAWDTQRDLSPTLRALVPKLSPADHTLVRDAFDAILGAFVTIDGSVAIPGRTLVGAATA